MARRGRQTMYAPQIYDNATRFNANKFGTFDLWKIGGYYLAHVMRDFDTPGYFIGAMCTSYKQ